MGVFLPDPTPLSCPGRYAVVPVTTHPLHVTEGFLLDLTADKEVEWEQLDDEHIDQEELKVSTHVYWLESGGSNNPPPPPNKIYIYIYVLSFFVSF